MVRTTAHAQWNGSPDPKRITEHFNIIACEKCLAPLFCFRVSANSED